MCWTALAIISLTVGAFGHLHHHHECAHDDPSTQRALHGIHRVGEAVEGATVVELGRRRPFGAAAAAGPEEVRTTLMSKQRYAGDVRDRSFRAAAAAPMRIVFRVNNLDDATKYCSSATGTSPNMQGGTVACSADTVFNSTHRDLLTQVVLPRAAAILSGLLSVVPVSGNLIVPSASSLCGGQYAIPSADTDNTTGVPNADFVVYISAAPTSGSTIAWAGYCSVDDNGRPVVARSNFSPKYLNAKTDREVDYVVRVGVHELLHALGFSGQYIQSNLFGMANVVKSSTRRGGQPVSLYTGPAALSALRSNTGCSTTDGVEIEDEGGTGTAGSHWDRRNHKEDVMCGIAGSVMTFSEMTFGLLEDSGHYTIDRTKTETEYYMKGAGCGVFDSKCDTTEGGRGRYFCFESGNACTHDFGGIGLCSIANYTSDLASYYRYFPGFPKMGGGGPLMNYCPDVSSYSNRYCNRPDNTFANNTAIGLYFGTDGRCFKTTPTLYKGGLANNGAARCFKSRCPYGTRIEFLVGDSTVWTQCPSDGSAGVVTAPSPYTGEVTCPTAAAFCTPALYYAPAGATTTKTTTAAPTTTKTTTTAPTTTKTTTRATTTRTTTIAPTTTTPILRAVVLILSPNVTVASFIAAFTSFYNISASGATGVVFLRVATPSDEGKISASQSSGSTAYVIGFSNSASVTAADNFLSRVETDSSLRASFGVSSAAQTDVASDADADSQNVLSASTFVIILVVAGVVVVLGLLVGVVIYCCRRKPPPEPTAEKQYPSYADENTPYKV